MFESDSFIIFIRKPESLQEITRIHGSCDQDVRKDKRRNQDLKEFHLQLKDVVVSDSVTRLKILL